MQVYTSGRAKHDIAQVTESAFCSHSKNLFYGLLTKLNVSLCCRDSWTD
jgi:hypothetical protein